jgi:hypothetical protein
MSSLKEARACRALRRERMRREAELRDRCDNPLSSKASTLSGTEPSQYIASRSTQPIKVDGGYVDSGSEAEDGLGSDDDIVMLSRLPSPVPAIKTTVREAPDI